MQHDAWFFVGIFVFIFLIWIATGGPVKPLSFAGPGLSAPDSLGGGTYLQFPRAPFGIGSGNVTLPGTSSGGSMPSITGGSFGSPSDLRNSIRLNHYVSGAAGEAGSEYLELWMAQDATRQTSISNWSLGSDATSKAAFIPRGTEVPQSGTVNASEDILLSPGDRAIIVTGKSPIGASFRENKCIGYFSSFQRFYPALPQNCPDPLAELEKSYSDYIRDPACIEYVRKLSRCQVVLSPPVNLSSGCQRFVIDRFNYNGCVNTHRNDSDFKGNTWRIYLGRTTPLWSSKNEIVKLRDALGKTVDAFSY